MTHIHVLAHIKRVRLPATRPAVDDLAASGEATSRDAQRLLGSPDMALPPVLSGADPESAGGAPSADSHFISRGDAASGVATGS